MSETREQHHYFESDDGLKLFYREFGAPGERAPVICLPGLTRNSRDFEDLNSHSAAACCRRTCAGAGFRTTIQTGRTTTP